MDCLFCKIINKEINADIIYEDEDVLVILDIQPRAPGHAIVLPKKHVANILELEQNDIGLVFSGVQKATQLLDKSLNPDGFTIGINQGRASGQTIDHLHIHIMPRWYNDGGGSIHSVVNNKPTESLSEIKNKILKNT
ncbi:MAG: HIT family protein [Minisyncoccia bacterium]